MSMSEARQDILGLGMRSYEAIARARRGYRENKFTRLDAIEDTLSSAIKACAWEFGDSSGTPLRVCHFHFCSVNK